jgi:hypothetical protein
MYLYLVRLTHPESGESFYKVGVTSQGVKERFAYGSRTVKHSDLPFREKIERMLGGERYIRDNPYSETVLHQVSYAYDADALLAERDLLGALKLSRYRPKEWFSGVSECFDADSETLDLVHAFMDEDCEKRNVEAPDQFHYKIVEGLFAKHIDDPIEKHLFVVKTCREKWPK